MTQFAFVVSYVSFVCLNLIQIRSEICFAYRRSIIYVTSRCLDMVL